MGFRSATSATFGPKSFDPNLQLLWNCPAADAEAFRELGNSTDFEPALATERPSNICRVPLVCGHGAVPRRGGNTWRLRVRVTGISKPLELT